MSTTDNFINLIEGGFKNFLSYGNYVSAISLDFARPVSVIGKNFDSAVNDQVDSNGSGKTTILNALFYAIYDNTISDVDKKDELINNINKKNMMVYAIWKFSGHYYKAIRYRKNKELGGDGVSFWRSDSLDFSKEVATDLTQGTSAETNKRILEAFPIPFEVASRILCIKASHTAFLKLPAAEQRKVTDELFGLNLLSSKAISLKERIKSLNNNIDTLKKVNEVIVTNNEAIKARKKNYLQKSAEWGTEHQRNVESVKDQMVSLLKVDVTKYRELAQEIAALSIRVDQAHSAKQSLLARTQRNEANLKAQEASLASMESERERLEAAVEKYSTEFIAEQRVLIADKEEKTGAYQELSRENDGITKQYEDLEAKIKGLAEELEHINSGKCPYCLQKYSNEDKTAELTEKTKGLLKVAKQLNKSISETTADMEQIEAELQTLTDNISITTAIADQHERSVSLLGQVVEKLAIARSAGVPIEEDIDSELKAAEQEHDSLSQEITEKKGYALECCKTDDLEMPQQFAEWARFLDRVEMQLDTLHNEESRLLSEKNPYKAMLEDDKDTQELQATKYKEIEELEDDLVHCEFLLKLLTKKDSFIRKAFLGKIVPFINGRIAEYLRDLGLPHVVSFTEQMAVKITTFDTEMSFSVLSDGQKARVNLALALAFRDLLEKNFGKVNLCVLDECLDVGLGTIGVQLAAKLIKKTANKHKLSLLVISHKEEAVSIFNESINVELVNGFSKLVSGDIIKHK